ncbi:MAG: vitamin B12-dependent ribonucleotide reductase [Candidatus Edwardsbacteria bacterium]
MIKQIRKRNGEIVEFDQNKIKEAILKAAQAVGQASFPASSLSQKVTEMIERKSPIPKVEEIQDTVEQVLIETGYPAVAKAYILYRQKHKELREAKSILTGVSDDIKLSINALKVMERRYLLKNENGEVIETPAEMFRRVAQDIASADSLYYLKAEVEKIEEEFYSLMTSFEFLPNSPTLMNAGTQLGQLAACFVLPVEDTIEGIFSAVKNAALIHKTGGGTGFSFSHLRPKNDVVQSTGGIASGPVSFMKVFDIATEVIKQGGRRRGANIGILRVDHPDILEFIMAKDKEDTFSNFNLSVGVTNEFMQAVEREETYSLINPRNHTVVKTLNAREIFELIVITAWHHGEPGLVFLDRINQHNPTPALGKIESTNPCGELPLLPYEACNLGSINLAKMVTNGTVDYERLGSVVKKAVHFLDNVIDRSIYPLPEIDKIVKGNRKIGLGVMGFADMLFHLQIPYHSEEALNLAEELIAFIYKEARQASEELAERRGPFPNFSQSIYSQKKAKPLRNATLTSIAPTGTISLLAGCSSGIEPVFALLFIRHVLEGTELVEINKVFEDALKKRGLYSEELIRQIAQKNLDNIPEDLRKIFVTALDITSEWHVRMQAAFQKYVDNAVSKTVNLPYEATPQDVKKIYWLAWKLGCKGITIYRNRSRREQVLEVGSEYTGICPSCNF